MIYGEIILNLMKDDDAGREQIILLAASITEDVKEIQSKENKETFNYFLMSLAYALVYSEKENAEFLYHVARSMLSQMSENETSE